MEIDYDWNYLSSLFSNVSVVEETVKVVESDRQFHFKSKPLVSFQNDRRSLEKGRLPDLRFQKLNIKTKIQQSVDDFMNGSDFVGLLIGPTGCGKTHELFNRAKEQFTVFIDAQDYPFSNETQDTSVSYLQEIFSRKAYSWNRKNQDLDKLRSIAYAFVLSRMLFLKFLKEKYPEITPTQFLIHQLFNSKSIRNCFDALFDLSLKTLRHIKSQFIDFECLFCVDEAHVLVEHLGDKIISSMKGSHFKQNGDVKETSKRGTLSVLLFAIRNGDFAKKILFAGTSSKLRNVDNFGSYETKPVHPAVLNEFKAWDSQMALDYVSAFVDIPLHFLKNILTDNYRPRILENLVYDLFCMGMNDNGSPMIKKKRLKNRNDLLSLDQVLKESYAAVIHRFTRDSIEPIAREIRTRGETKTMLKLLLSSMMTRNGEVFYYQLDRDQIDFYTETIGSIYLIEDYDGYSFFEGYVIDSFLDLFSTEFEKFNLCSALELFRSIIGLEGKKTSAKGVAFEAVVLADLTRHGNRPFSQILADFNIFPAHDLNQFYLPTQEVKMDDKDIISTRPLNVFLRPSNQFRPDLLAFLSKQVCVSFGIKLYTSEIPVIKHKDNVESTDPDLFFSKSGKPTHSDKHFLWNKSIQDTPITFSARFLIELPEPKGVLTENSLVQNGKETAIILITKNNMRELLSNEVADLIDFILKP